MKAHARRRRRRRAPPPAREALGVLRLGVRNAVGQPHALDPDDDRDRHRHGRRHLDLRARPKRRRQRSARAWAVRQPRHPRVPRLGRAAPQDRATAMAGRRDRARCVLALPVMCSRSTTPSSRSARGTRTTRTSCSRTRTTLSTRCRWPKGDVSRAMTSTPRAPVANLFMPAEAKTVRRRPSGRQVRARRRTAVFWSSASTPRSARGSSTASPAATSTINIPYTTYHHLPSSQILALQVFPKPGESSGVVIDEVVGILKRAHGPRAAFEGQDFTQQTSTFLSSHRSTSRSASPRSASSRWSSAASAS